MKFTTACKSTFNLVIVDIFINSKVPKPFTEKAFCHHMLQLLKANGQLLFNLGINLKINTKERQIARFFENKNVKIALMEWVNGSNTLLLASAN